MVSRPYSSEKKIMYLCFSIDNCALLFVGLLQSVLYVVTINKNMEKLAKTYVRHRSWSSVWFLCVYLHKEAV